MNDFTGREPYLGLAAWQPETDPALMANVAVFGLGRTVAETWPDLPRRRFSERVRDAWAGMVNGWKWGL